MSDLLLTDDAVLVRLGERLTQVRLQRDLTQRELAVEAGVGSSTVERIESGKSVTLANFVRVLRALGLQDELLNLAAEPSLRPAELAQRSGRRRQRVSSRRRRVRQAPSAPFAWGDQRDPDRGGEPAHGRRADADDRDPD